MIPLLAGRKVLTCVMPKGYGLPLLRRLSDELGIVTASLHSARGLAGSDPRGVFSRVEKDVLTLVLPEERADELFLWMHQAGEVGTQPGRFLYAAPLTGATSFSLPDGVPWEGA